MKNNLGIIFPLRDLLEGKTEELFKFDLECIQICCWEPELYSEENAKKVLEILDGRLYVSSIWAGWDGPATWNVISGPSTLGIVPEPYRFERVKQLRKGIDFAHMLGVKNVATHMGFIPESPSYENYRGVVEAIKWVGSYAKQFDINFNFETGQETPVTLMRALTDAGLDNLGVNLDPANLIIYGRGNPVDAVGIFGDKIKGVHIKDGVYASGDYYRNGRETKVGEGMVNFPVFIHKLIGSGYTGDLYIEREITGPQQTADINDTIIYIKKLLEDECK